MCYGRINHPTMDSIPHASSLVLTNDVDENDSPFPARITTESISARLSTTQTHSNCFLSRSFYVCLNSSATSETLLC